MNRRKSTALVLTGLALAMATFVGVFALLNDTTDTGEFSVESAAETAGGINLRIAQQGLTAATSCDEVPGADYVQNSTFDIQLDDAAVVGDTYTRHICVRNTGPATANVRLELLDRSSYEVTCTDEEALVDIAGGAGCGPGGELAARLLVDVDRRDSLSAFGVDCDGSSEAVKSFDGVPNTAATNFGQIEPGSEACYRVTVTYNGATDAAGATIAQTDGASWRFRFHGTAA
jgi:hypothetical protein